MRNPDRLDEIYETLFKIHKEKFPDMRFGQFMSNFLGCVVGNGKCHDVFFPEDDKWLEWVKEFEEKGFGF